MHKAVGSRELKTRLGAYLRRVQQGATLILTDRGRPVAEMRPLSSGVTGIEARINEMVSLGILSRTSPKPLAPFKPIRGVKPGLSRAVIEGRADRV